MSQTPSVSHVGTTPPSFSSLPQHFEGRTQSLQFYHESSLETPSEERTTTEENTQGYCSALGNFCMKVVCLPRDIIYFIIGIPSWILSLCSRRAASTEEPTGETSPENNIFATATLLEALDPEKRDIAIHLIPFNNQSFLAGKQGAAASRAIIDAVNQMPLFTQYFARAAIINDRMFNETSQCAAIETQDQLRGEQGKTAFEAAVQESPFLAYTALKNAFEETLAEFRSSVN